MENETFCEASQLWDAMH